jgi:hypothetical protein
MQSVGEERNAYRLSLLWLEQYGTTGHCARYQGLGRPFSRP